MTSSRIISPVVGVAIARSAGEDDDAAVDGEDDDSKLSQGELDKVAVSVPPAGTTMRTGAISIGSPSARCLTAVAFFRREIMCRQSCCPARVLLVLLWRDVRALYIPANNTCVWAIKHARRPYDENQQSLQLSMHRMRGVVQGQVRDIPSHETEHDV